MAASNDYPTGGALQRAIENLEGWLRNFDTIRADIRQDITTVIAAVKDDMHHDWYCPCGHWNGPNLDRCGQCGRTPNEGRRP
jgi:hypothetical protein